MLERNPDYFRRGFPAVHRVLFRILPNPATTVAALESGDVDFVLSVPGPDVARLRARGDISIVQAPPGPACCDNGALG